MSQTDRPVTMVTGSSLLIGRDVAIRLAKEGYALVLNGVRPIEEGNTSLSRKGRKPASCQKVSPRPLRVPR